MVKKKYTTERCPECEQEVKLLNVLKAQTCPNCGARILPCSICDLDKVSCTMCPLNNV